MATEGKPQATDIVIGAGSGIGGALVDRWRHDGVRPVLPLQERDLCPAGCRSMICRHTPVTTRTRRCKPLQTG